MLLEDAEEDTMADWHSVATTYWPYLLGVGVIGLILGWFVAWLVERIRSRRVEARLHISEQVLADAHQHGEALRAELSAGDTDLASLRNDLEGLQQNREAMAAALEERRAEVDALEQELAQATRSAESTRESLESVIAAIKAEKLALQGKFDAAQVGLAEMTVLAQANGQALAGKDTALNEAYAQVAALQREVQEREAALFAAQTTIDTLKIDLKAAAQSKAELENKLHRARGDVAAEMALVTSTMLKIKDEALNQATARIAQLTNDIDTLRACG